MTNFSELKDYLYLRCILYAYCFIVFKYMECFLLSNVILLFYLYIVKKITGGLEKSQWDTTTHLLGWLKLKILWHDTLENPKDST